jgi:hypothetical protein
MAATWIFVTCHAQALPQASRLEETIAREGPEGLMWPSASGQIMRRSNLQLDPAVVADKLGRIDHHGACHTGLHPYRATR